MKGSRVNPRFPLGILIWMEELILLEMGQALATPFANMVSLVMQTKFQSSSLSWPSELKI